jgi:hypothetical protein
VVLNAQVVNNIRVQRKIFVPSNDSFCRWLNIFTNQDTVSRTFNMITGNNLGSDSNTIIVTTSDGDTTPELSDNWVTTMQNYSGGTSTDPRIGHVLKGPGAPVGLASINFANGDDNPYWAYTLTLAPGETAIIMNFAVGQPSKAQAAAKCVELITLPTNALACMTSTEISQVRNFSASASHTVRFLAGANGWVDGNWEQTVANGGSTTAVRAMANAGYIFLDWNGDNGFYSTDNPLVVNNVTSDMTITASFANLPPSVIITSPVNGATVSGPVSVQVQASDSDGIASVTLAIDGRQISGIQSRVEIFGKAASASSLYSFNWDTLAYANGTHSLQATAYDNVGLSASVTNTVNVNNAILSLQATRLEERTWTMVKEYAHLVIGLNYGTSAVAKYSIMRKEGTGPYVAVKEISLSDLQGSFTWNDGYLNKGSHYAYRVLALNSAGATVGGSPEVSL